MQTPPSNYPRPDLATDRQSLKEIAVAQKQVLYCALGQICIACVNGATVAAHIQGLALVVFLLSLALLVFMVISVYKLSKALNLSPVLYVVLMFVPCVSLIMLVVISQKASTVLQQAGVKVGLLGADPNSI